MVGHRNVCCLSPGTCVGRGARLVIMGDSISRFQYLDLIYGLSGNEEALQRHAYRMRELDAHTG